jgi:hypothetical protein
VLFRTWYFQGAKGGRLLKEKEKEREHRALIENSSFVENIQVSPRILEFGSEAAGNSISSCAQFISNEDQKILSKPFFFKVTFCQQPWLGNDSWMTT